jgi:L-lactate dehydrogenase complex protein LldG
MSAKDAILGRIRDAVAQDSEQNTGASSHDKTPHRFSFDEIQKKLGEPAKSIRPALKENLIELLTEQMEGVQMTVTQLQTSSEVVDQVNWYLESQGLTGYISVSPALQELAWNPGTHFGAASSHEVASVTDCFGAVAETGSVVMASSADSPMTLGFVPDTHIVVVKSSTVHKHTEDIWQQMR